MNKEYKEGINCNCPYISDNRESCKIFGKKCLDYPRCNHKLNPDVVYKPENIGDNIHE